MLRASIRRWRTCRRLMWGPSLRRSSPIAWGRILFWIWRFCLLFTSTTKASKMPTIGPNSNVCSAYSFTSSSSASSKSSWSLHSGFLGKAVSAPVTLFRRERLRRRRRTTIWPTRANLCSLLQGRRSFRCWWGCTCLRKWTSRGMATCLFRIRIFRRRCTCHTRKQPNSSSTSSTSSQRSRSIRILAMPMISVSCTNLVAGRGRRGSERLDFARIGETRTRTRRIRMNCVISPWSK